ncbi:MAG: hypothetical protein IMZ44_00105 [Planctomycetes bacterium]|nr:hypothetical protein [Planctomycetota bacterium]
MSVALLDHDGKRYLVRRVLSSSEGLDTFDVAALEVDAPIVEGWIARMDLVQTLVAAHGLHAVEWVDDSPDYYGGDDDADELDEDETPPPRWDHGESPVSPWSHGESPGRTDCDRLVVMADCLWWSAYVKQTDVRVETSSLSRGELVRLLASVIAVPPGSSHEAQTNCAEGGTCGQCGKGV